LTYNGLAQDLEERVQALEGDQQALRDENAELRDENTELRAMLDGVTTELERFDLGGLVPPLSSGTAGLGPAGSKVYGADVDSLSIGGYGEFLFEGRAGRPDRADALRSVTYLGYKFDERWVLNTELELEHATTSSSSGTTASGGAFSLEFGYLDYMHREELNVRAGLLLAPMGLVNELHEPTTYLAAHRPQTEQRIIPTTWRELGAGVHGRTGDFSYRGYVMGGLDGEEFDASGLRGGRQKGSRAAADDLALVGRLDWEGARGVQIGGSLYVGDSGQDQADTGGSSLGTTIAELHADVRRGPWRLRGLVALADLDDVAEFNAATGAGLAEELTGHYLELGYDVLAGTGSGQSLTPFVRYEALDTQSRMPAGFAADPRQDDEIWTVGVDWKPLERIVIKVDYDDWEGDGDSFNILLGYVF
jgi:hypothetical protein